jgi:hypothetical protein
MLILHCGSATVILDFVELDLQPSIWTILGRERPCGRESWRGRVYRKILSLGFHRSISTSMLLFFFWLFYQIDVLPLNLNISITIFWLFYMIGESLGFLYLAWEAILILPCSFTLVQVLL